MSFISDKFNESFTIKEGYQYKDYDITVSNTDGNVYIRDSKGNLVGTAPTDIEAEEFVDDLLSEDEEQTFTIKYIDSIDKERTTTIKAHNRKEAEVKAKMMPEVYKIIR